MALNVAQKLIEAHLALGRLVAGDEIALRMDQTPCRPQQCNQVYDSTNEYS